MKLTPQGLFPSDPPVTIRFELPLSFAIKLCVVTIWHANRFCTEPDDMETSRGLLRTLEQQIDKVRPGMVAALLYASKKKGDRVQ